MTRRAGLTPPFKTIATCQYSLLSHKIPIVEQIAMKITSKDPTV